MESHAASTDPPAVVIERLWQTFLDFSLGAAGVAVGRRRVLSNPRRRLCVTLSLALLLRASTCMPPTVLMSVIAPRPLTPDWLLPVTAERA